MQDNNNETGGRYVIMHDAPSFADSFRGGNNSARSRTCLFCSRICVFFGLIFVAIAGLSPLWTVASLKGNGDVFQVDYDVDFKVGTGIFERNVCFGGDKPEEEELHKYGLSCETKSSTDGCKFDDKGNEINGNTECKKLKATQGLFILSIFTILVSIVLTCCATPASSKVLGLAQFFTILSLALAIAVAEVMRNSDMMNKDFQCSDVNGADFCYDRGASVALQTLGGIALAIAVFCMLLQAVFAYAARRAGDDSLDPSPNRSLPVALPVRDTNN